MRIWIRSTGRISKKAFTLTEIIVTMVTLSIGAAGLLSCFSYGFATMQSIRDNQRATQIMLEKAETLRLYSWDQVRSNGFIPPSFIATYDGTTNLSTSGTIYTGTLAIASFPFIASYKDNMKQLTVTLSWNTRGVARTRTLNTFIAKDGIQNYVY